MSNKRQVDRYEAICETALEIYQQRIGNEEDLILAEPRMRAIASSSFDAAEIFINYGIHYSKTYWAKEKE